MTEEQKPITEPEASAEPDYEKIFPIEDFKDTVLLIFKTAFQGSPVQLEVFGSLSTARVAKSGGIHEFQRTNGRFIEIDGHDVLWAECITANENRRSKISRAWDNFQKLQVAVKKEAEEKAAKEKAEAAAKALEDAAPTRKGLLSRLKGGSR